jgi:hypothetical protein
MNFLAADDCRTWAAQHGFSFNDRPRYADLEEDGFRPHKFEIPSDAGRRVALARLLWESVAQGKAEAVLWVTDWSVWPSGEHMPLVTALRRAFGEGRTLDEAPGHQFRLGEDAEGLSFFCVALLFLWDAYLLAGGGEMAVFISHDEYGVVLSRNTEAGVSVARRLASFAETAA